MARALFLIVLAACFVLHAQSPFSQVRDNADGTQTFDIVISLYRTPNAAERIQYEEIITSMANTIWEATNRGHYLGNVRIFQDGRQGAIANIIWNRDEWPRATTTAFNNNTRYGKIWVGDIFNRVNYLTSSAENRTAMGYTLGHEWSHFVYGVYDQYVGSNPFSDDRSPCNSDIATIPSIMNSQWSATGNNFQWINYDTRNNYQAQNAQGRVWGMSCWDLLVQDVANDPLLGNAAVQPTRRLYGALIGRAPTAANTWRNPNTGTDFSWMQVDLGTAGANPLRDLNIIWAQPDVELAFIVDRSGSMGTNNGMVNAKLAAKTLVNFLSPGGSVVGITSFSSPAGTETENVPMTAIPDPAGGVITTIQTAIDGITSGGQTAMFNGANFGLSKLDAYRTINGTNAVRIAMLLSDGENNASNITGSDVIDAYKASNVPLYTFGYGSGAGHAELQNLAVRTNGMFFPNLTSAADLSEAYINAVARTAGFQLVPEQWTSNSGFDFNADATMNGVTLTVPYTFNDATGSVDFEFRDAANNLINPAPVINRIGGAAPYPSAGSATIVISQEALTNHGAGTWHVDMLVEGSVAFGDITITTRSLGLTPELMVENLNGVAINYPSPLMLTASVVYGKLLTGLTISAILTAPDGSSVPVQLYDDGTHGDVTAHDGVYSTLYSNYTQNGEYYLTVKADNMAGTAMLTDLGNEYSIAPDGSTYTPSSSTPMTMPFARMDRIRINVSGVVTDDHGNNSAHATNLPVDNTTVPGKLEDARDVDFFEIIPVDATNNIVIRISDMDPLMKAEVTVFAADGSTILGYSNINVGATGSGYLMVTIDKAHLVVGRKLYVAVNDLDGSRNNVIYKISAGQQKIGDAVVGSLIEAYIKDEGFSEANIVKPRLYITNTSSNAINGFTACYYFTVETGEIPVYESYYTPDYSAALSQISGNLYKVTFTYNRTLAAGATTPDLAGSVGGLHYLSWRAMDKTNDFSNPGSSRFIKTDKIAVFSTDGMLIGGSFPLNNNQPPLPPVNITVYSREDKLSDNQWTNPRLYIVNNGTAISNFTLKYYFATESGKNPVLQDFYSPNAIVSIEHISGDNYALVFKYTGFSLATGGEQPGPSECSVGLHFNDWSNWNKTNDQSNNLSTNFSVNPNIEVFDMNGNKIY
jgi:hypothetical protein